MKFRPFLLITVAYAIVAFIILLGCTNPFMARILGANDKEPEPESNLISLAAIPGLTVPKTGETPVMTVNTDQYTGTVAWNPAVSGAFAPATAYTATITLTAEMGFTLDSVSANFFIVAGALKAENAANSGVITATFPTTAGTSDNPATVDIFAIWGVTPPATGATPVTAITETVQYAGIVEWYPDVVGTFEAEEIYVATITLEAKLGYTLVGVAEDFFKVAGATTINDADSGVIRATFPATKNIPIPTFNIMGVTAPVTGATPVTTITETGHFTGTVTWSPDHTTFAAATTYTATIHLTARSYYTLQGVAANSFKVDGATSTSHAANSGVITAIFPSTDSITINIPDIPDIIAPVTGAIPVTNDIDTTQYTGKVAWSPNHATFAPATVYTATIALTPKEGYTTAGVGADFFTVAGATTKNNASSGVVTAVFPATASTVINIPGILGVTAPATGATPVTVITEAIQYTGTVAWNPAVTGTFASNMAYTATITLTPKTGYTLEGVLANFFTVANATVIYAADSNIVTAEFPVTATTITTKAIPGITTPVTGATPVTNNIDTDEYTGTVAWSGNPTTFAGGTAYTATITLAPTTGYTFTGVAANTFTVAGTTTVTHATNSGTITATFPRTDTTVTIAAIPGVTVPVAGATPVTEITPTDQFTGTVVWSNTPSTFAASTAYTATITLTAKTGFTLHGVTANFFTVAGTSPSATNAVNSDVVTATFPATAITISTNAIPGVTAPVVGATPVTAITETAQYTGTVAWSDNPTTFAASTAYTATITLAPKTGFTLHGVAANFFSVDKATTVIHAADSGVITAVFPATASTVVITITVEEMTDIDPTITLPNNGIIYKNSANGLTSITLTLENPDDYDVGSIEWTIPAIGGQPVTGNGISFTVDASNPNYNSIGGHTLTLVVRIDGAKYSKIINFEIKD